MVNVYNATLDRLLDEGKSPLIADYWILCCQLLSTQMSYMTQQEIDMAFKRFVFALGLSAVVFVITVQQIITFPARVLGFVGQAVEHKEFWKKRVSS